ncbi:MAG: hypothetical protein GW903_06415 [Alphaproteobacteria bacterium]|nr:hypothetical protein [Alphaproteobacteria bacterium]NCQ88515.1 hypothetical protein [Alphaproteobacteria bacterium]NCT06058.1 hypothetical protein [Alphaproteobacteria bacterium]
MSSGSKTLLIILLIPFLMGVAHDVYYNYFSSQDKIIQSKNLNIDPAKFKITDAGWVFIQYAPNTFQGLRSAAPQSVWRNGIDPILRLPTMVVGLIPFLIAFVIILLNKFLSHNMSVSHTKTYMQGKTNKSTYKRR